MSEAVRYTSALARLRALPPVFRGADLTVRFGWSSKIASQYLYRWRLRSLIQPLGGRSDVFANLLAEPNPDWEQALRLAMPSAVLVGIEALRRAGWTTQIERRPSVAVRDDLPVYATEGFSVSPRPTRWWECVEKAIVRPEGQLPRLLPEWALADLLDREGWGACGLHPDDVDWHKRDKRQWCAAQTAFALADDDMSPRQR